MVPLVCEDIAPLVRRVCEVVRPAAEARGITITAEGSCPPIPHHRTHLFNALYGLVGDAIPYVDPGGSIRVILSQVDGFAEISVVDTGTGLPEDIRARVMSDQIYATTVDDAGLSSRIATLVTEAHGGEVSIESTPGVGCNFRMRFPTRDSSIPSHSDTALLAVHGIATRLFARPGLDEVLTEVLKIALESADALAGAIWLHDPRDDALVFHHGVGGKAESLLGVRIPAAKGIAGAVFQSGQVVITGNAGRDIRHIEVASDFRTDPMVTIPLRNLGGQSIGVMQVLNKVNSGEFSAEGDLVVLETLASLAATAIVNAQQAEQARKAAVADAVGDIAHHIKNMMTTVEWWMYDLDRAGEASTVALERIAQDLPPEREADAAAIRELLKMLPEAIRTVRDRSREVQDRGAEIADALKGKIRPPVFVTESVKRTIGRVCSQFRVTAEGLGLFLTLEGDCRPFPHDRTHLFRAVYNLVNNAIPHVPAGGSVRVVLSEVDGFAEIAVIDTGSGMSEAVRRSLFTDAAISTTVGGTGLGTRFVAKVAEAHGGSVSVQSSPGSGAAVRLRIPLVQDTAPEQASNQNR